MLFSVNVAHIVERGLPVDGPLQGGKRVKPLFAGHLIVPAARLHGMGEAAALAVVLQKPVCQSVPVLNEAAVGEVQPQRGHRHDDLRRAFAVERVPGGIPAVFVLHLR